MRGIRIRRILGALTCAIVLLVTSAVSAAAASARPGAAVETYLALGDSLSTGYQPERSDDPGGGYVGPVARGLAARGSDVRMINIGCTGETTATMVDGGRCRYAEGSQLAAARAALARYPDTRLITLSIGANDLRRCVQGSEVDALCSRRAVRDVRARLDVILPALRRAAPRAQLVVLDYYNPYVATSLLGTRGRAFSATSTLLHGQLNSAVRAAARDADGSVAYVSSAFDSTSWRRTDLPGRGRVPQRVARICTWTWMCSATDIHPNDRGYAVMAQAVLDVVDDGQHRGTDRWPGLQRRS